MAFLFLVWTPMQTVHLLQDLLLHIAIVARKTQNVDLKKQCIRWGEGLAIVKQKLGANYETASWASFSECLRSLASYTTFICYPIPKEIWSILIERYEELAATTQAVTDKQLFSSSVSTKPTSTSCTTVPTLLPRADVPSPGTSKTSSACATPNGGLFDNIDSDQNGSTIPCSISKKLGDKLCTFKSEGAFGDTVVKLDLIPYSAAATKSKKDWWSEASLRTTVTFQQNSALAIATEAYTKAIMDHFQSQQVGPLSKDTHYQRQSSFGYGNIQPRR
ncbi:hypothetical protein M8J76_012623 [Diaphorina citri]|nr:hypothetical protein M8J76_012623 [Diaphorina citri]